MRAFVGLVFIIAVLSRSAEAALVALEAVHDNSIFGNPLTNSNALGDISAGKSGTADGYRRGLIAFDLSGLPADARVDRVALTLRLAGAGDQETQSRTFALHSLHNSWGEGTSNAGAGGAGIAATAGDATWQYRFFANPTSGAVAWDAVGGDFSPASSATALVGTNAAAGTFYTWETVRGAAPSGLVADVEQWLASPATNFGWLIKAADETTPRTVRRFSNRTDANETFRPRLTIEYTSVPEPAAATLGLLGCGAMIVWQIVRKSLSSAS